MILILYFIYFSVDRFDFMFFLLDVHWIYLSQLYFLFQIILESLNNFACWFKTKNGLVCDHQLDCQTTSWPSATMVIIFWNFFTFYQILFTFVNSDLLARLSNHYEAWRSKKKKHKEIKAYRKSVLKETTVKF